MSAPSIKSYRDLQVWQSAMTLAEACYKVTKSFPREEMFGMTSQIRRAATSIAANIAEGHGRENTRTFIQYLRISQGSLKELETHLLLSERVGLASEQTVRPLLERFQEEGKMIRALVRVLQQRSDSR